jgi:hypothetical protein
LNFKKTFLERTHTCGKSVYVPNEALYSTAFVDTGEGSQVSNQERYLDKK